MPQARYTRPLAEYARIYETTDRAIKRWIRIGKDCGQLPPLDDPRAMVLSWWPFAMTQRAPAKLLAIADRFPEVKNDANDASYTSTSGITAPTSGLCAPEIVIDLRAKIDFARKEFDSAIAAQPRDATKVAAAERLYSNLIELWHKVEVKVQEIKKQAGLSIDRYEVTTQYSQDQRTLRDMRETMARRIIAELERANNKKIQRILRALEDPLRKAIETVRAGEEQIFVQ